MTLMKVLAAATATLTALTLTACTGGSDEASETTPVVSTAPAPSDGPVTAVLLHHVRTPGEMTGFPAVMKILDREGIGHSNESDTSDDPHRTDAGSGHLDVDGLGTVYFALMDRPDSQVGLVTGRIADGSSDTSHEVIGANWAMEVHAPGADDAVVHVAESMTGSAYAFHGGDDA